MVLFPNCKINLGLRVREKRTDGYHDLDTVFYPLPLRDAAEIIVSSGTNHENNQPFELYVTGNSLDSTTTDNLCYKAWRLLAADFPGLPYMKMYLHKAIPSGAGLGGGSSDAASTLKLLNELLNLQLTNDKLLSYALKLGSDCPFFLINRPSHATGRGELLKEISLDLDDYSFVLVHPGIHVNTSEAFSDLDHSRSTSLRTGTDATAEIVQAPVSSWRERLINDFEEPVFRRHPAIAHIKTELYTAGAVYASLTGSGSCVYGIFNKTDKPALTRLDASFRIYHLNSLM